MLDILLELWRFLIVRKKFWLLPVIVVMVIWGLFPYYAALLGADRLGDLLQPPIGARRHLLGLQHHGPGPQVQRRIAHQALL